MIAAEVRTGVHHDALLCLLSLFDATAEGICAWSEYVAEAARLSIEDRGLSREDLAALIAGSTGEIPITKHRRLHQEDSDFVRWGIRGGLRILALYSRTSRCSPASDGAASNWKP